MKETALGFFGGIWDFLGVFGIIGYPKNLIKAIMIDRNEKNNTYLIRTDLK